MSVKSNRWFEHIPNALSIGRGILAFFLPYWIFQDSLQAHILASVLFTVGSLSDYWDGYIARKYHIVSDFGKFMDPVTDKLLILLPLWAFSKLGFFSFYWLVPVIIREVSVTFFRIGWLLNKQVIAAEKLGKWKLGLQVATVGFALIYLMTLDGGWSGAVIIQWAMFISLISMVFLSLYSGFQLCWHQRQLFQTPSFARYLSAMGVGLLPWAPGTWGSAVTLPLIFWLQGDPIGYAVTLIGFIALGYWAVSKLDLKQNPDPGFVVIDEACGMMVTMIGIPWSWTSALLGFFLFRIFDIVKPFPVRRIERLPGYWGILCDDLAAGVYAWCVLKLIFMFL